MSFALGVVVGALAGYLVGSTGSRASRTWREHRDTRTMMRKLGTRRLVHAQTAVLAWVGLAALVLLAVSTIDR